MNLSLHRFAAVLRKEVIQARRDRFTLALMVGMPLVQLFLFGFAINTDPKHLPTALVMGDDSRQARSLIESMRATEYFDISPPTSPAQAEQEMARGDVLFVLEVPAFLFLGFWFGFQLWEGGFSIVQPQAGGGVAFFAHIGGFAFGVLTVRLFMIREPLRPRY